MADVTVCLKDRRNIMNNVKEKKEYVKAEIELIEFDAADVVTGSVTDDNVDWGDWQT